MILKVNPTRVNLLSLKKELKTAKKGHKLLKDKRDGLMKTFLDTVREAKRLREDVEEKLGGAFHSYIKASAILPDKTIDAAFMLPNADVSLDVEIKSIMSVAVPRFTLQKSGTAFSYGYEETSGELDTAIKKFDAVFADIIRLAELERTAERLADEIERTRRRVSSLENTRIPNIEDTIAYIEQRLEEQERDAVVSTMRVKAMIMEKEGAEKS